MTFLPLSTHIQSQLKKAHGNLKGQYPEQGLLLFDNNPYPSGHLLPSILSGEFGMESWMLRINPRQETEIPIFYRDQDFPRSVVAIECFVSHPMGIWTGGNWRFLKIIPIYAKRLPEPLYGVPPIRWISSNPLWVSSYLISLWKTTLLKIWKPFLN